MQVRFWGTRGSLAKPGPATIRYGGNTSCVELRADDGTLIIIDCGTGAHELGQSLIAQGAAQRGHIFISHTHWDHIQGIPFFAPLFQPGNEWDIYGPKGLHQSIRETLSGQMEHTYFPITPEQFEATIRYHDLVEGGLEVGEVRITARYLNHTALTLGYRFQVDGAAFAYCCDHEPNLVSAASGDSELTGHDKRHADFLSRVDLVVHDAQYTAAEYPEKVGWGHSTGEYVVRVCQDAGVRTVALTHHDPTRDDDALDEIILALRRRAATREPPIEIIGAAEGLTLQLEPPPDESADESRHKFSATTALGSAYLARPILLCVGDDAMRQTLIGAAASEGLPQPVILGVGETLKQISADDYSLLLVQHDPPRFDALEFARRIRRDAAAGAIQVPIAIITTNPEAASSADNAATEWLVAPFSLSYARTKMRSWVLRTACRWVRAQSASNEAARLKALQELAILDTPEEGRFDRITRIASATFDVPIVLVSLVDANRQWFKSSFGLGAHETPRDMAFCAHVVEQRRDLVVNDALLDERFADNPLVLGEPRVRFYAGAPLMLGDDICLGTLCLIDHRPRALSAAEIDALHDLRDIVLEELKR